MRSDREKIKTVKLVYPDLLHNLTKIELHPVLPNLRLITRVKVLKEAFPNPILKPNVTNVRVMDI